MIRPQGADIEQTEVDRSGEVSADPRITPGTFTCPVNSYNEWDPLEEIIVGHIDNATIPSNHVIVTCNLPKSAAMAYPLFAGFRYPKLMWEPAHREVENLVRILEAEGVRVRRPDVQPFHKKYATPMWSSRGFNCANPRDGLLVLGNEIIETPMAWRSRYFELFAYRRLLKEYFEAGAKWTSAPKPDLNDELFVQDYQPPREGEPIRYVITEHEPVFDAADFVRCGRDLFVTRSNVTNQSGIEWLRRHLGDTYRITEIVSRCTQPMHIDTTFMPLAPGKVLVNPEFVVMEKLPEMLKGWEILVAPEPDPIEGRMLRLTSMCGRWLSMNVLMLDEKRVICEKKQPTMIRALKKWGFEPIPCEFQHYAAFGGAFHCATLDIRRRGELRSYFD